MLAKKMYNNYIVTRSVDDKTERRLFENIFANLDMYNTAAQEVDINMRKLNYYNVVAANECHMSNGIFGESEYKQYKFMYRTKVIGNLTTIITSAHRIMTALKRILSIDRNKDWVAIRKARKECERIFSSDLRNFIEHLEENIQADKITNDNFHFSTNYVLYCKYEKLDAEFKFDKESLNLLNDLIDSIIDILSKRENI